MAKTNKVARHHEFNKIAAILQEMGTQYVEQFLPGRGRAEQWQLRLFQKESFKGARRVGEFTEISFLERAPVRIVAQRIRS
jgi:hypothetical protein